MDMDDILERIWEQHKGLTDERLGMLDALLARPDDPAALQPALDAAHKLAGSLGTFGMPEGSRLALEAEERLRAGRVDGLEELVAGIREAVAARGT